MNRPNIIQLNRGYWSRDRVLLLGLCLVVAAFDVLLWCVLWQGAHRGLCP